MQPKLKFDGSIQDFGSQSRNVVRVPVKFSGKGSESSFLEAVESQIKGMHVISSNLSNKDGLWTWEGVVESENGIPGSHRAGVIDDSRLVALLPKSAVSDKYAIPPINSFSFGDVSTGNPCSFGDL